MIDTSDKLLQSIVAQRSVDAIFIVDARSNSIIEANPAAISLLGYSIDELKKKTITDLGYESKGELVKFSKEVILNGKGWVENIVCRTKSGKELIVEISSSIIEEHNRHCILSIVRDISKRKQVEQALKQRLKIEELVGQISTRFLNVTESSFNREVDKTLKLMGILTNTDRSYVYLEQRKNFVNTHEWISPDFDSLMEVQNDADPADFKWIHDQLYTFEVVHISDINNIPPNEEKLIANLSQMGIKSTLAVPIQMGNNLAGFLGFDNLQEYKTWTTEDISLVRVVGEVFANGLLRIKSEKKLKKANKKLTQLNSELEQLVDKRTQSLSQSNQMLKEANEELDNFVYRAAHDLKGPIKRLVGLANVALAENNIEKNQVDDYLEKFRLTALSMDEGLSKLLISNEIDHRKVTCEEINLVSIIKKSRKEIETVYGVKNVQLGICGKNFHFSCNHYMLSVIIQNLMENAYLFSVEGNQYPQVNIRSECLSNVHVIQIEDNGTGIDKRILNDIKKMFFRGSSITGGSGLGLYLADKAIKKLNGQLQIESEYGQWTKATIRIPLQE